MPVLSRKSIYLCHLYVYCNLYGANNRSSTLDFLFVLIRAESDCTVCLKKKPILSTIRRVTWCTNFYLCLLLCRSRGPRSRFKTCLKKKIFSSMDTENIHWIQAVVENQSASLSSLVWCRVPAVSSTWCPLLPASD